jgi:hypothetical protein
MIEGWDRTMGEIDKKLFEKVEVPLAPTLP